MVSERTPGWYMPSAIGSAIGLVLGVASAYFGGTFDLLFQRVMDVFTRFCSLSWHSPSFRSSVAEPIRLFWHYDPLYPAIRARCPFESLAIRKSLWMRPCCGFLHLGSFSGTWCQNGTLPDYAHRFSGAGDPHGSLLIFPWYGHAAKPTPAWGLMLQGGAEYAESAPWVPIFPGLAITLAVLRFNLFGDAVRDTLDHVCDAITRRCFAVLAILPISRRFGTGRVRPLAKSLGFNSKMFRIADIEIRF